MSTTFATLSSIKGFSTKELNEVSDSDVQALMPILTALRALDDDVSTLATFTEAAVFDVKIVYAHLAKIHEQMTTAGTADEFPDVVKMAVGIQVVKGNLTAKNFARLVPDAQALTKALMGRLKLTMKLTPANRPHAVTLPRLSDGLPILAMSWASKVGRPFHGPMFSRVLPKAVFCSPAAAMIPRSSSGDPLEDAVTHLIMAGIICYSCDLSITVGAEKDLSKVLENQKKFATIKWNSPAVEDRSRKQHLKDLGLHNFYDNFMVCGAEVGVNVYVSKDEWATYWSDDFVPSSSRTVTGIDKVKAIEEAKTVKNKLLPLTTLADVKTST